MGEVWTLSGATHILYLAIHILILLFVACSTYNNYCVVVEKSSHMNYLSVYQVLELIIKLQMLSWASHFFYYYCTLVKIFPRSRRDLGAFLAAEKDLGGRRPKTRRDYWRDLAEKKISAAKNAPRLEARSRLPKSRRDYERSRRLKSRRVKWRDVGGENGAKMNPRRPKTWRESLGGQRENLM